LLIVLALRHKLILVGALISIVIDLPLFRAVDRLESRLAGGRPAVAA
jgi:hypothetical protein